MKWAFKTSSFVKTRTLTFEAVFRKILAHTQENSSWRFSLFLVPHLVCCWYFHMSYPFHSLQHSAVDNQTCRQWVLRGRIRDSPRLLCIILTHVWWSTPAFAFFLISPQIWITNSFTIVVLPRGACNFCMNKQWAVLKKNSSSSMLT